VPASQLPAKESPDLLPGEVFDKYKGVYFSAELGMYQAKLFTE
jgi:hypothetical protein